MFDELKEFMMIKDVKVILSDDKDKLGFTIVCSDKAGSIFEIIIPDINLHFVKLGVIETIPAHPSYLIPIPIPKTECDLNFKVNPSADNSFFSVKQIERAVSKEVLEKELGYKLNIK